MKSYISSLLLISSLVSAEVDRTWQKGCYDENKQIIPDCSCSQSCHACGFYDDPTDSNDCIECMNPNFEVRAEYSDGTGFCISQDCVEELDTQEWYTIS